MCRIVPFLLEFAYLILQGGCRVADVEIWLEEDCLASHCVESFYDFHLEVLQVPYACKRRAQASSS